MVLFKRKPVTYLPAPQLPDNLNVKAWYIPYTKEWFLTYDEYLKRMDYYNTKKFVCEITGNSCLTFFEAYESEEKEMKIVEKCFPEHLKEPILRHLQFSTVPRIDQLVDEVYTSFKNDYYPGETVMIRLNDYKNDFKTKCIIREKAKFNAVMSPNNNFRPAHCKYRVSRLDNGLEIVVDEHQVTRDRNNFTKWFVKTFIKLSVTRSPKLGAPWMVRQKYADQYKISTEFPPELARFKEEPKPSRKRLMLIRPKNTPQDKRPRQTQEKRAGTPGRKPPAAAPKAGSTPIKAEVIQAPVAPKRVIGEDLVQPFELKLRRPHPSQITELSEYVEDALEAWAFLNVYRVPLLLDSFTFDDFLTALKWKSDKSECSLLNEIFCSVLSAYMPENGKELQIQFPEEFDDDIYQDEEEEDEEEVEREPESSVIEDSEVKDGSKPKSKSKSRKVDPGSDSEDSKVEDEDTNRVDEYLTDRVPWLERLEKRNFKDGSWQIVLLGILDEVRTHKAYKDDVEEIFDTLAPLDSGISPANIKKHFYNDLPLRLRIKALSFLTSFLVNSTAIRSHLDKCMEDSAQLRRERFEIIREYKTAYEKAQDIDRECREALGTNGAALTPLPTAAQAEQQSTAEPDHKSKKRRRAGLTIEPTEQEFEFAKSSQTFGNLLASRTKQLRIAEELRLHRRTLEKKLAELDVQRIKYVGKDRLFNRYWWFESNGLPNLGGSKGSNDEDDDAPEEEDEEDDDEEVLDETYLMGRLWVQGPSSEDLEFGLKIKHELVKEWKDLNNVIEVEDDEEEGEEEEEQEVKKEEEVKKELENGDHKHDVREESQEEGLGLPHAFLENSKKVFNIVFEEDKKQVRSLVSGNIIVNEYGVGADIATPSERKIIEEMPDPLLNGRDWRYYDRTEEIELLLKWLNPWGERESKLLKELSAIKEKIVSSITARRKALKLDSDSEEEQTLKKLLEDTILSDSEVESTASESDTDVGSEESEIELISVEVKEEEEIPRTRRSIAEASKLAEERRRQEELIKERIAERQARKEKSKPSLRIAKREMKRRKIKEHEEKKQLIKETKERLDQFKTDNAVERCLDWVNQSAIDELGHSHYDGPKKIRVSGRRGGRR